MKGEKKCAAPTRVISRAVPFLLKRSKAECRIWSENRLCPTLEDLYSVVKGWHPRVVLVSVARDLLNDTLMEVKSGSDFSAMRADKTI